MFGPGTGGKCPVGGVSIAGSGCEPGSFCHLSEYCRIMQPETKTGLDCKTRQMGFLMFNRIRQICIKLNVNLIKQLYTLNSSK